MHGKVPASVPGHSLFARRKMWSVRWTWAGREWVLVGSLEFANDLGNALFDVREFLTVDTGPYVGVAAKSDYRDHDRTVRTLWASAGKGWGDRWRDLLSYRLRHAEYEFPKQSVLKARAA